MSDITFRSSSWPAEYLQARATFDAAMERLTQQFSDSPRAPHLEARQTCLHAHEKLLLTAPSKPTNWWPGGWVPAGFDVTAVWRTEQEVRAARPPEFPSEHWVVRWTPFESVAGCRQQLLAPVLGRKPVAFDASFWRHNTSPVHLRVIENSARAASYGIFDTALWLASATASGMLGNAAYDAARAAARQFLRKRSQDSAPTAEPSPRPVPDQSSSGTVKRDFEIDLPRGAPPVIGLDSIEP